jgi:hypothetical protein
LSAPRRPSLRARPWLGALALALVAGCSSMRVDADWNPQAHFDKLSTWGWLPREEGARTAGGVDDPLLHQRIEAAIEDVLAGRGYALAEAAPPDFLVAYHVAIEKQLEARTLYSGYNTGVWIGPMWSETYIDEYRLGTLLIDVIEPARREVVWRGRAQARVQEWRSPEQREARVREAVEQVLAKFPPPAR